VSARVKKETAKLLVAEIDPRQILNMLLTPNVRDPEKGPKIHELIEKLDFSDKSQNNDWLVHRAYELYPEDVVGALVSLLESGKPVPVRTDDLLLTSDIVIDEGLLVKGVLQNSVEEKIAKTVVSIAGPKTIGQLINQIVGINVRIKANDGKYDKVLSHEYHRLSDWISNTKPKPFIIAVLERTEAENPYEIALLADLISRHGGSDEREPLRLDATVHERITTAIRWWAKILLTSSEATRSQFAEIAQTAERLRSTSLVPVLHQLLSEDLVRRKRAMAEFTEARKRGHQIQNNAHMSWTLQYRRAFAAIGDDQTVQMMKSFLSNPDFGFDAAHVLKAVWKKSQPTEDESGFIRLWPDFSVVPEQSVQRQSRTGGETHAFVNDILAVVDDLIKPDTEDNDYRHALKLATIAFSMFYVDKDDTIASLLQLRLPAIDKQDLLTVLVLAGEKIPSKVVLQGIDELLEKAKTNPWILQEQYGWRLNAWLRLLPFTEIPDSILSVLDRLEDRQLQPWNLRELLSALSYAPSVEAENILSELAKRDERFLIDSNWLAALANRNTLTAARILLDLVCNVSFSSKHESHDRMDFGRRLSNFMNSHEQFRQEIYERFPRVADSPAKSILEYAIGKAADADGILLLVRASAAQNKGFRGTSLYTALRHVLVGQTPIESSEMQQLYSLPAPELRKGLFNMVVNGNSAESRLAAECLTTIDEIRDDYGHVDAEPRHPNIAMGVPWPLIALAEPND